MARTVVQQEIGRGTELVNREIYQQRLELLVEFLDPVESLLDLKLATFITEDLWEKRTPAFLLDGMKLSAEELEALSWKLLSCEPLNQDISLAEKFMCQMQQLAGWLRGSYDNDNCLTPDYLLLSSESSIEVKRFCALTMMSVKKFDEVNIMQAFIARRLSGKTHPQIIDVGSGKGYLSSVLTLVHGFDVLGLEALAGNISASQSRLRALRKQWPSIKRKLSACNPLNYSLAMETSGSIHFIGTRVDRSLDVRKVLSKVEQPVLGNDNRTVLLCGLHTCGNLGADIAHIFAENRQITDLIYVGCCYNLMDDTTENAGCFPLSRFLRDRQFRLGRNARLLACQNAERLTPDEYRTFTRTIFFRALLQVLLDRKFGKTVSVAEIGRIAKMDNPASFWEYVRGARKGLAVDVDVTEDECEKVWEEYAASEIRLRIFQLYRIRLGALVEQIITLDRACYLQELGFPTMVVPIFDPVKSPRCWAICSRRA